jgi:hypothetical protein
MSEDVGLDLVSDGLPARREICVAADLGKFRRAVQGEPAHQLGGHVVLHWACDLTMGHSRVAASGMEQDGVQHGAEHVVLALVERSVADPYRRAPA